MHIHITDRQASIQTIYYRCRQYHKTKLPVCPVVIWRKNEIFQEYCSWLSRRSL